MCRGIALLVFFSALLFLTGCINVEVTHTLNRDGTYDVDLTLSTTEELGSMLDQLKQGLEVEEHLQGRYTFRETETSITYSFTGIDLKEGTSLFKEEEHTESEVPAGQATLDSTFFRSTGVDIRKESSFPYNTYSYTLTVAPTQTASGQEDAPLPQDAYIIDEANILNEQTELMLTEHVRSIYNSDGIEMIVSTKQEMDAAGYMNYRFGLTGSFPFRGRQGRFLLLFVSADGYCRVDTNLFRDAALASRIQSLDAELERGCVNDPDSALISVARQLDSFFEQHDLAQAPQPLSIDEQITVSYTVRGLGSIVNTTGLRIDKQTVQFDVNPGKEATYTATFRELALAGLLGRAALVFMGMLVLSAAAVIVLGLVKSHQGSQLQAEAQSRVEPASSEVSAASTVSTASEVSAASTVSAAYSGTADPRLSAYVRDARAYGMTDAEIKHTLLVQGWSEDKVRIALT